MCVYGRKHVVGTAHDYPEHPRPKPPRHHATRTQPRYRVAGALPTTAHDADGNGMLGALPMTAHGLRGYGAAGLRGCGAAGLRGQGSELRASEGAGEGPAA